MKVTLFGYLFLLVTTVANAGESSSAVLLLPAPSLKCSLPNKPVEIVFSRNYRSASVTVNGEAQEPLQFRSLTPPTNPGSGSEHQSRIILDQNLGTDRGFSVTVDIGGFAGRPIVKLKQKASYPTQPQTMICNF